VIFISEMVQDRDMVIIEG